MGDEFAEVFPHLRRVMVAALVAGHGRYAGRAAAADVLAYAHQHWPTVRHRHDLVVHLFRLGRRMAARRDERWDEDPISRALQGLTVDDRLAVVLRRGHDWSFDEITEVTGLSVAAAHRHHDRGLAKVAAALRGSDAG